LIGDIERGGVFASLAGTVDLLEPEERQLIKAFVINKFRGDRAILEPGFHILEERTGVPMIGVIPWFDDIYVVEEDTLGLEPGSMSEGSDLIDIAVVRFPHLSNFDDLDMLQKESGVSLHYVDSAGGLDTADIIILPGSKTTMSDFFWLRQRGLDKQIIKLHNQGAFVIGICGGYQMLGQKMLDPEMLESPVAEAEGLGLLPLTTVFSSHKETHQVKGEVKADAGILSGAVGINIEGYEIHMGTSDARIVQTPFTLVRIDSGDEPRPDGALDDKGRVLGTYIHGLFQNTGLRRIILRNVASDRGKVLPSGAPLPVKEREYDKLAELVRQSLDMSFIYDITGLRGRITR
jgi:adenosylcobyric acid synthase